MKTSLLLPGLPFRRSLPAFARPLRLALALSAPGLFPSFAMAEETTRWYRGNTHTHSLWSDGNDFPEMIVDWYHQRGYDFIALSDHNILAEGEKWMALDTVKARQKVPGPALFDKYQTRFGEEWVETRENEGKQEVRLKTLEEYRVRFEQPGKFLILPAEEVSSTWKSLDSPKGLPVHINAVNLKEVIKPALRPTARETIRAVLLEVLEQERRTGQPMLAHLNHPNFQWAITAEDVAHVIEERFVEVYNGHPSVNHLGDETRPGEERIWDIANTIRLRDLKAEPLWGLATDDSHHYDGGDSSPGRGWIMVRAARLEPAALIEAMKKGDFYASSGVILKSTSYDPSTRKLRLAIDAQPGVTYTCALVGTRGGPGSETGEIFERKEGEELEFTVPEGVLYARVTVTASRAHENPSFAGQMQQAWTQPVAWR